MARTYHTKIAAFAANADAKWVDNLLSHSGVPGVSGGTRGASRRISAAGIRHIALVHRLNRVAGFSVEAAVALAERLLRTGADRAELGAGLELQIDRQAFEREVEARIHEAVESIVPARRGRRPKR